MHLRLDETPSGRRIWQELAQFVGQPGKQWATVTKEQRDPPCPWIGSSLLPYRSQIYQNQWLTGRITIFARRETTCMLRMRLGLSELLTMRDAMPRQFSGSVLVTGSSISEPLLQPLRDAGLRVSNPSHLLSEAELLEELADASAYLLGGDEIPSADVLRKSKRLRLIAFLGVGYQSFVDGKLAGSLGIAVTNTPGTLTQSVAEFAIGQMLNATRRLSFYESIARRRASGESLSAEEKQTDLAARRVGIIGLGAIGGRVAEILATGFGCAVSYYSRTRKPDAEAKLGIVYRQLDDLLSSCDMIGIFLPRTDETIGMINTSNLKLVPPSSIVVNISNADVIDGAALAEALSTNRVATVALDQSYGQSEQAKLLEWKSDRVIYTGHIGSLTHQARDGMAVKAVGSILGFLANGDDAYVVNRAALQNPRR